jgi:hypothetical protein
MNELLSGVCSALRLLRFQFQYNIIGDDDFDRWEEQAGVKMVVNIRELSYELTVKPKRIARWTAKDSVISTVQPNKYRVEIPCYALYCGPRPSEDIEGFWP